VEGLPNINVLFKAAELLKRSTRTDVFLLMTANCDQKGRKNTPPTTSSVQSSDSEAKRQFLRSPLCGAEPLLCPCSSQERDEQVSVVVVYIWGSCAALSASLRPIPLPMSFSKVLFCWFCQGSVAARLLAVASDKRQHANHHCLGSRAALLASPSPISPHSHKCYSKQQLVAGWAPSEGRRLLARHLLAWFVLL
jgi:hypothetical protein